MATAAHSTHEPLAVRAWNDDGESDSKSERYLARRLAAASADFKGVALITFLLGAGVAALLWLAGGVAIEHWLVAGGLPRWARWTWLLAGLAALATAAIRWIVPLVRYRVNLVYAAHAIEREHPELHNDIVNTVLVKASPQGNAAPVVRSLERRVAKRLSAVPAETVIDRTAAVRLAYALALLVGLACIYSLAAPKSMLVTAARLLAPWSRLAAPTRVGIESPRLRWRMPGEAAAVAGQLADAGGADDARKIQVDAGRATLVRGRQLVVSSVIHGLRRNERPTILVTPLLDGGAVDRAAVPWRAELTRMSGEGDGALYVAVLPDTSRGLDQSLSFEIQAGDAKSEPIGVALVDSPSLLVREVRYEFPPYMRRENETLAWQGDLRGVEGTRVVIVAESNQPLESAWIDFGCDGSRDLKLKVGASDLARATGAFVLLLNAERTAAEHSRYRLVFQPKGGASAGPAPVATEKLEHRIEVLADLAPEISIEEPRESPLRVPPGAPVAVRVRALDPDFGLARVAIETRLQDGAVRPEIVLPGSERAGAFNGVVQLVPERLGAGPDGKLEYRGVAVDTRPDPPNVTHTPWRVLQLDASAPPRQPEKRQPPSGERPPDRQDGGSGDDRDDARGESGAAGEDDAPGEQGQPSDAEQDGGGEPRASDGHGEQQKGKSGAPEKPGDPQQQGSEQRRQRKEPQSGERQGEPQPGQQNGAASGGNEGGEQPQAGAQAARKGGQGRGGDAGDASPSGEGRGAEGRGGGNGKQDGQQDDGEQGRGGEQAGRSGDSRRAGGDRQADGERQGENKGGKRAADGKPQNGRSDGQRGGGQPAPRAAVAADGTNDGEAMERILEHRRQSGGGEAARDKTAGGDAGSSGQAAAGNRGNKPGEKNASDQAGDRAEGNAGKRPGDRRSGERGEGGDKATDEGGDQNEPKDGGEQQHAERDSPACANAEGQPCGKAGCKSCGGGSKSSGGSAGGEGGGQGQQGQGEGRDGQGEGRDSQGQQGQGEGRDSQGRQGQGQQGQSEGRDSQGQQGQGEGPAGKGKGRDGNGAGQQGRGDGAGGNAEEAGQQQGGQPAAGPSGGGTANAKGDPDQQGKAGGKAGGQQAAGAPPQGATETSPVGGGGWSEGAAAPQAGVPAAENPPAARDMEWGPQELENARNAADLAIEHLRTTVESGRTDVLDELGWTRDQARAFLERWEAMRRQAADPDPRKRGEFDRGLRSLGLRPKGVQSDRDVPADVKGGQAEGRRSRPPSDYRERFKAFLQGTSGVQNADAQDAGSP